VERRHEEVSLARRHNAVPGLISQLGHLLGRKTRQHLYGGAINFDNSRRADEYAVALGVSQQILGDNLQFRFKALEEGDIEGVSGEKCSIIEVF
jgi:hypothetical protein